MKRKPAMQQASELNQEVPNRTVRAWETADGVVEARAFKKVGKSPIQSGHFVELPGVQERIRGKTVYHFGREDPFLSR